MSPIPMEQQSVDTLNTNLQPQIEFMPSNKVVPYKKRFTHSMKQNFQPPLCIDISDSYTAYAPQVEPVSPPTTPEGVSLTEDEINLEIIKTDVEIEKIKNIIAQHVKRRDELEMNLQAISIEEDNENISTHLSLSQKIYAENRMKARMTHLKPLVVPLYNQPSDSPNFMIAMSRHALFKDRLILHLRKKAQERAQLNKTQTATYSKLMGNWRKTTDAIENSPEYKLEDIKYRKVFEETFPQIKKNRIAKMKKVKDIARAEPGTNVEDIIERMKRKEIEDMRSRAVVPPPLLDSQARKYPYINTNARCHDMSKELNERGNINIWSEREKEVFEERFMENSKCFGAIASSLETKSASDCVQHYYLTKKQENYKEKELFLRRQKKTRVSSISAAPSIPISTCWLRKKNSKSSASGLNDGAMASSGLTTPAVPTPLINLPSELS